jgi:predicted flap endonuclease-1-like 5' DNA nuclease
MAILVGAAFVVLGLVIGIVVGWAVFGAGVSMNLGIGLLLVFAGIVVGFVSEWLIDEAYRKNRELRRLLGDQEGVLTPVAPGVAQPVGEPSSTVLADFLRQRDDELRALREQVSGAHSNLDSLRDEYDGYRQTHPDDMTVIKGIGPVYQWKLRDAGIHTYKQLAAADPQQLQRMLGIRNWQRTNVDAWIAQARDWAQRSL